MATNQWYRAGTVALTASGKAAIGIGTLWSTQAKPGDVFTTDGKTLYEIDAVTDDTHLTLVTAWGGSTASGQAYAIIRNFNSTDLSGFAADLAGLLNKQHLTLDEMVQVFTANVDTVTLTNSAGGAVTVPTWNACAAAAQSISVKTLVPLKPAANKLAYWTAGDSAALTDLTAFGRSLLAGTTDAAVRTVLGLGTVSTQSASAMTITGGTVTGLSKSVNGGYTGSAVDFNTLTTAAVTEFASSSGLGASTNAPTAVGVGILEVLHGVSGSTQRTIQRYTTINGEVQYRTQDYTGAWGSWRTAYHNAMSAFNFPATTTVTGSIRGFGAVGTDRNAAHFLQTDSFNEVSLCIGYPGSMAAAGVNDFSAACRFGGSGKVWGDLSYYPAATVGDGGQFRFSTTGNPVNTVPNASLGIGALNCFGTATINGPASVGSYTLTTLPSAAAYTSSLITVSNATGGRKLCQSDGAAWKIINTTTTVS